MNDLSGSRGEANFVWRCKNCKRESSATIKAAPASYEGTSPAKAENIIEIDTRGLEFTDFKADVSSVTHEYFDANDYGRESGKLSEQNLGRGSLV